MSYRPTDRGGAPLQVEGVWGLVPVFELPDDPQAQVGPQEASSGVEGESTLSLVRWRDAWFTLDDEDREDCIVETVGWIEKSTDHFVRVVGEHTPDGDRAITHIPRENVIPPIVPLKEGACSHD